jgi:hypothetical protein
MFAAAGHLNQRRQPFTAVGIMGDPRSMRERFPPPWRLEDVPG